MSEEPIVVEEPVKTKEAPNYKGDVVEALALMKQINIPCEAVETEIAEQGIGWNKIPAVKLPKLLIIVGLADSQFKERVCIKYYAYLGKRKWQQAQAHVPSSFKFKVLTGNQGVKMVEAMQAFQLQNLGNQLGHGFQIGADPEVFVEDGKGVMIPAFTFLGSKKERANLTIESKPVYWDGPQAEFETQPGTCLAYQVDSIHHGLKAVYDAAQKVNKNAKLSIRTVMEVPADVLQTAKEEHIEFGCMPSLNVYGFKPKIVAPRDLPFRSTGGHMHFGVGKKTDEQYTEMVKALDSILSVCAVSLFANYDNPIRRQYYGMVGEYRLPPHGIEYRTPSNAWIGHPMIAHMFFDLARKVLVFGEKGFRQYWKASEEETVRCVQECDVNLAHEIMERNKGVLLSIFSAAYHYLVPAAREQVYNLFYNGVDTGVKDFTDVDGNWKLNGSWSHHSGNANATCGAGMGKVVSGEKV
jgi:hypothetical protein